MAWHRISTSKYMFIKVFFFFNTFGHFKELRRLVLIGVDTFNLSQHQVLLQ